MLFTTDHIAYKINILSRQSLRLMGKRAECRVNDQKWMTLTFSESIGSNLWVVFLLNTQHFCIYLAQESTIIMFYLQEYFWDKNVISVRWFQGLATYRNVEVEDYMSSWAGAYLHCGTGICPCLWILTGPSHGVVTKKKKKKVHQYWHLWEVGEV